jgi:prephenate dehydratase
MITRVPAKDPWFFIIIIYMKVSIQGETGCFHEVAARQYFNYDAIEIVPCATFDHTIGSVLTGEAAYAVMAIENARSGSILQNYTLIRESGMKMLGEHNLRIIQNLMVLPGQTIDDIHEVRSHPIALAQCMDFLKLFPSWTLIESDDTAGSAKQVSENKLKGIAAIASSEAARIYGLEIIAPGIETYKQNYTRFLVVGPEERGNKKGNKVSICFSTGHKPGSLAKVLVKLAEKDINLSKIQSVPRFNGQWQYMFYCDLELPKDTNSDVIKRILRDHTTDLEILGVYYKGDMLYES